MKKASILLGTGILSLLFLSFIAKDNCEKLNDRKETRAAYMELQKPFIASLQNEIRPIHLNLDEIAYIKGEEEIELGFDTTDYLPMGFNAYEGMDTKLALASSELTLADIPYIEMDDEIDLGFDTQKYLPEAFDPYSK